MVQILYILLFVVTGAFLLLIFFIIKQLRKLKTKIKVYETEFSQRQVFINAAEGQVYLKDENLKYVFANNEFYKFAGKQKSEIVGNDDFGIFSKELAKKIQKTDLEALEKGCLVRTEEEWDGKIYQSDKFPVLLANGRTGIGASVRDITEETKNKRTLQKTLQRNNILLDVINRPFETTKLQLDYVLNEALKLTGSRYGHIYLYDEEKEELVLNTWSSGVLDDCSIINPETKYFLRDVGFWGEVIRQRRPIINNDFQDPGPLKKGYPQGHIHINRFISIPVMMDEKIVAIVGLANKEEDYDENDVFHMSVLMAGVWNAKIRKETQEKLFFERNEYLQTLVSIGDGVMVVNREGKIEILNTAAETLTGWTQAEAAGKEYLDIFKVSLDSGPAITRDPIRDALLQDRVQEPKDHTILTSKNGVVHSVEVSAAPIRGEQNKMVGVVLVFRDVTEKKEQRREIEFLSFHDPLTGLYNRRFFEEAMLCLDTKANIPVSIIMGDVNGLKLTNDVYGHMYGDILLRTVAEVLKKVSREDDIVARYGGDEFVLLLPKTGREEAVEIIRHIKMLFEQEQVKAIKGSMSIGLDTKQEESEELLQVLENAEEKMYIEKALERKSARGAVINEIVQTFHESSELEKMHALRVSALCYAYGRTLSLPDVVLRKLRDAGYLHDIGKIGLDTKILDNKDVLSTKEWGTVKRHPIIGFRILNAFDGTLDLAEPVLAHHEKWDGSGYPKGLKGDEIPLIARIVSLVESYDRIVYAGDKTVEEARVTALATIRKNAGGQFDPVLAQAFIRFVEDSGQLDAKLLDAMHIRF